MCRRLRRPARKRVSANLFRRSLVRSQCGGALSLGFASRRVVFVVERTLLPPCQMVGFRAPYCRAEWDLTDDQREWLPPRYCLRASIASRGWRASGGAAEANGWKTLSPERGARERGSEERRSEGGPACLAGTLNGGGGRDKGKGARATNHPK